MEQTTQINEMQNELKRLKEDVTFIMQVLTDPDFSQEDREFYMRTWQAQKEIDQGEYIAHTEEEFKARWNLD